MPLTTNMEERGRSGQLAILMILLVVSLPISMSQQKMEIGHEPIKMEQFGGGGGSLEEQCGSITFENMFEYTHASFDIIISDDWETAEVKAEAWVNDTLADELRTTMDEFMELLDPNKGGDGWFSTDEREFFRALASECIEHTLTRIGIRDGPAHRGGVGIDWKNTTWQEDGVQIEEWNIVPSLHSEIRGCTSSIGGDCKEVPVVPNQDRDCDTSISQSQGEDECRVRLWLNATMSIEGVENPSQFTFSLNASNLSGARFDFKFPSQEGLRMSMWDECEGRDVGLNESTAGGLAPTVGSCIGDGSSTFILRNNSDGSITLELSPNGFREDWPSGEDLFFDFTTEPIGEPDPPSWTDEAPLNGTWIPVPYFGEIIWAEWDKDISRWFQDDLGVGNLDVSCQGEQSYFIEETPNRGFQAILPDEGVIEVTCSATDQDGYPTENRTWFIGVPLTVSSSSEILTNPHQIKLERNGNWPDLNARVLLVQEGISQELGIVEILDSGPVFVEGDSSNIQPGNVDVRILVSGVGIYDFQNTYSLGIIKESSPPAISIAEYGWDGNSWSMGGQFSDPDGEEVLFSMEIDGNPSGNIFKTGNLWNTPNINFILWERGEHQVKVIGCDASNMCSEVYQIVNNSFLFDEVPSEPDLPEEGGGTEGFLPSNSSFLTVISLLFGLIYVRGRE